MRKFINRVKSIFTKSTQNRVAPDRVVVPITAFTEVVTPVYLGVPVVLADKYEQPRGYMYGRCTAQVIHPGNNIQQCRNMSSNVFGYCAVHYKRPNCTHSGDCVKCYEFSGKTLKHTHKYQCNAFKAMWV